jgi:hypothetical protein
MKNEFKSFWKNSIGKVLIHADATTSPHKAQSKFKAGDRVKVKPHMEPDGGKKGKVEYVNSGGGIKVSLDDGESETFGDDEITKI